MQTPTEVLDIGADVAKDEIVVACARGRFPVRKLANQRSALLSFLKGACPQAAASAWNPPAPITSSWLRPPTSSV